MMREHGDRWMVRNFWLLFYVALFAASNCEAFQTFVTTTISSRLSMTLFSEAVEDSAGDAEAPTGRDRTNMENAWRSIKKPLMSIGAKGVAASHANSLSELLKAHTVVKVKIRHFGGLEAAFHQLSELAEQEIELLQCRDSEGIAMIGAKGSKEKIQNGSFPPPVTSTEKD